MPGVPISSGCCGGPPPGESKVNAWENNQEDNQNGDIHQNTGDDDIKYGVKEPCCCVTRCGCGSQNKKS